MEWADDGMGCGVMGCGEDSREQKQSFYRILHDGIRYKVQGYSGWWIFKRWQDLGRRMPPFTPGSWICTYYNTRDQAQKMIYEKEAHELKIHKWEKV